MTYQKYQMSLALFGVVGLLIFGASIAKPAGYDTKIFAARQSDRILIPKLNIEIDAKWEAKEIAFDIEKVDSLGKVAWVRSKTADSIAPCFLGAYYLIEKNKIHDLESKGMKVTTILKAALKSPDYLSARAKEFNDSFLVFEPNKKICPGEGLFEQKRETELRKLLWESIPSASAI